MAGVPGGLDAAGAAIALGPGGGHGRRARHHKIEYADPEISDHYHPRSIDQPDIVGGCVVLVVGPRVEHEDRLVRLVEAVLVAAVERSFDILDLEARRVGIR